MAEKFSEAYINLTQARFTKEGYIIGLGFYLKTDLASPGKILMCKDTSGHADWEVMDYIPSTFNYQAPLYFNESNNTISIYVAGSLQDGYLTKEDWNTFNNKQSSLVFGDLTESTSNILTISGGTGAVIGSGVSIEVEQSDSTHSGYLTYTDWNTFNNKQAALSFSLPLSVTDNNVSIDLSDYVTYSDATDDVDLGDYSITATSGIFSSVVVSTGATEGYVLTASDSAGNCGWAPAASPLSFSAPLNENAGTVTIDQANTTTDGYLTKEDWSTFNSKEGAISAGTTAQYYRGDKTWQTLNGAAVANTASGDISATNVQAAIVELDSEKLPKTTKFITTVSFAGPLAVYTGKLRWRPPVISPATCSLIGYKSSVNIAPTGAGITLDVNKNGVSTGTTMTIAATNYDCSYISLSPAISLSETDYLTVDIDSVGSTVAGSDLTATLYYTIP